MGNRRAGVLSITVNGDVLELEGEWTFTPGIEMREGLSGPSGPAGYKGTPQVPSWAGRMYYNPAIDVEALIRTDGATVVGVMPNGKVATLRDAWAAGAWAFSTDTGTFEARFEGLSHSLD